MHQWIGLGCLLALIAGLLWAYLRKGAHIKTDGNKSTDDWPRITLGGS
jgi:hypothetical protein